MRAGGTPPLSRIIECMAHTDSIEKIIIESTRFKSREFYEVVVDGRVRYARATPMRMIWPAGDPSPNDRETLVEWISQDEYLAGLAESKNL